MVGEITGTGSVRTTDAGRLAPAKDGAYMSAQAVHASRAVPSFDATVGLSSPRAERYAERLDQLESSNQAALAIRSADAAMARISDSLAKMKQALTQIVKQYPPFALDSGERVEYLNSIAGLRKQIEALTIQPGAGRLGAAASYEVSFPGGGQFAFRVSAPGLDGKGLDIPVLGARAGDDEVAAALDKVSAAGQTILNERSALAGAVRAAVATPGVSVDDLLRALRP